MTHVLAPSSAELTDPSVLGAPVPGAPWRLSGLDPRMRIAAAGLFAVFTVALSDLSALALCLAVAVGLLALSRRPMGATLKRMAMMDGFIFAMLAMLPFTTPGTPIAEIWGLTASAEGLRHAAEIALTANAVILALMALAGGMEPVTLGHALHALRCPEKLVHLMMFTIRYVDVLRQEYLRLRTSMKVRGFRPGMNMHTYRSYGYLVGMMLVRAVERSERVMDAMKCRGFAGRLVLLDRFALRPRDYVFAALFLAALAAPGAVELFG
ncbi:cobalt ECF transporter T component CbiQ [Rhodovulum sp. DZ06]|uniref:cobalt ECF transporter T component CbiQ n=1 Tax=Rhodovulum sp. DZ06 TaxID=3425126 RepID=UPI003D341CD2